MTWVNTNDYITYHDPIQDNKNIIKFGIEYLDLATDGLSESDLCLIGAESGAGKTEISTLIAQSALKQQKKVYFFALEAEKYEMNKRIHFRIFSSLIANKVHYRHFVRGKYHSRYMKEISRNS